MISSPNMSHLPQWDPHISHPFLTHFPNFWCKKTKIKKIEMKNIEQGRLKKPPKIENALTLDLKSFRS